MPLREGTWHVELSRSLAIGRYKLAAGGNDENNTDVIRFRVLRD